MRFLDARRRGKGSRIIAKKKTKKKKEKIGKHWFNRTDTVNTPNTRSPRIIPVPFHESVMCMPSLHINAQLMECKRHIRYEYILPEISL